jgi:processive 1,2-diacylglycerol beta-glucosyltransferase
VRVEILTMDGGNGTLSASHALRTVLEEKGATCRVTDIMGETNPIGSLLSGTYNRLLSRDIGLASAYMRFAHAFPPNRLGPFNDLSRGRLVHLLRTAGPDVLVLVCPWISGMVFSALDSMGDVGRPKVAVVVVDLGRGVTRSWLDPRADLTVLPTEESAGYLLGGGRAGVRAEVIGIPVHPQFFIDVPSREEARARLGLAGPVVTVLGGREGGMSNLRLLEALHGSCPGNSLVIQCGKNARLLRKARGFDGVTAIGFVPSMRDLMLASDVVVTKPGALTLTELITLHANFIVSTYPAIMPQERGNVELVREHGLAPVCPDPEQLPDIVRSRLARGRPEATFDLAATERIAESILGLVGR